MQRRGSDVAKKRWILLGFQNVTKQRRHCSRGLQKQRSYEREKRHFFFWGLSWGLSLGYPTSLEKEASSCSCCSHLITIELCLFLPQWFFTSSFLGDMEPVCYSFFRKNHF